MFRRKLAHRESTCLLDIHNIREGLQNALSIYLKGNVYWEDVSIVIEKDVLKTFCIDWDFCGKVNTFVRIT